MPKHLCDDRACWRPVRRPVFPPACARTSSNSHPVTNDSMFPLCLPLPGLRRGTRPRKLREQPPMAKLKCALRRSPACHELFLTVPLTAARRLREVGPALLPWPSGRYTAAWMGPVPHKVAQD